MRLLLTIISTLWILQCVAGTEGFQSRQYTAADGLPNHTVRHILQDSHGFVWIATLNGLTRFDGTRFVTFRSELGNPLSLSDNRTHSLTEDDDQFLWIETTGRIFSCFDLQKGRFVSYTESTPSPYNRIFVASDGDVWLSSSEGAILRITHNPDRSLTSRSHDGLSSLKPEERNIFSLFESDGHIHVVTADGHLFKLTDTDAIPVAAIPAGQKVTGIIPSRHAVALFTDKSTWHADTRSGSVTTHPELDIKNGEVVADNTGRFWIYNHTGQITFHSSKDNSYKTLKLIPSEIMAHTDHERYRVVQDAEGTIWISTYGNGLFAYREDNGTLEHFTAEDGLIGSNSLRGMMLDATGTLWLGTGQNGISTLWRDRHDVRRFVPNVHNPSDRSNSIRVIEPGADNGILFSAKDGNLYEWTPDDSVATHVGSFKANVYAMMAEGKDGPVYGTRGDGLIVGDRHYRHEEDDQTSLPDDNIYFIHRDSKGRVWIGTFGEGLALMTPDTERGASFQSHFSSTHGRNEMRHMIEDADGRFWIGTSEGLLTFHPDSLPGEGPISEDCYKVYSKATGTLSCNEVRFLRRDSKGMLWIATGNDGVICASTTPDGDLAAKRQYTVADGLGNNSVQSIAEDDEGNLWIATEYGLARLNPKAETMENFIFSEEPQGNAYAEASVLKQQDGSLLFGTSHGILHIDPRKFSASGNQSYPLRFTRLSINGTAYGPNEEDSPLTKSLDYTDRIVLSPHQDSFAIEFSAMDFRDKGRLRYSYLLEGYGKEWSAPSQDGTAAFSYLPSGSYTLMVICLDGGRVVAEGRLEIVVKAPWWRTPWAIISYLIIIVGIAWLILRRKVGTHGSDENVGTHGSCVRELDNTVSESESYIDATATDARAMRPYQEDTFSSEGRGASDDFLERVENIARANVGNPQFSVDDFAAAMNLGRAVFYRRLKETAGTTPNEYLKKMRMQEAARLLRTAPELNIAEISDRVGFSDSLYFSKCYKAEFGQSPTSYRKSNR